MRTGRVGAKEKRCPGHDQGVGKGRVPNVSAEGTGMHCIGACVSACAP